MRVNGMEAYFPISEDKIQQQAGILYIARSSMSA